MGDIYDPKNGWAWFFWFSTIGMPVLGFICIMMMRATMPPKRRK